MRCIENFDLTSEMLLGTEPFPEETCPHNYPIYEYLESLHQHLLALEAHDNEACLDTDYEDYSEHGIELIHIANGFHAWLDDWSRYYTEHLRDAFTETEQAHIDHCFVDIEHACQSTDLTPTYIECAIDEISKMKVRIDMGYEAFFNAVECYDNKASELSRTLNDIDYEIQRSDDDEFPEMLEHRGLTLKAIELHQQSTPNLNDFIGTAKDDIEAYMSFFGGAAHRRFAIVRHKMIQLKQLIKQYAKKTDSPYARALNEKPIDVLKQQYQARFNDETTLYCASPETFIRRCQQMEKDRPQLCPNDKDALLQGSLDIAFKRLLVDYSEYEYLVWFVSLEQAICYGTHEVVQIKTNTKKKAA